MRMSMLTGRHHRGSRAVDTIVYAILFISCLSGCSSLWKARERNVVQHDTTTVHHRDTSFLRDSIYIREWMKGDTVYIEKYKDRYFFRDRWRDSVRVVERHDTTAVEVPVEKSMSWSQKAKITAFPWVLLAALGLAVWTFRKYLF